MKLNVQTGHPEQESAFSVSPSNNGRKGKRLPDSQVWMYLARLSLLVLATLNALARCHGAPGELDLAFNAGAVTSPPSGTQIAIQTDGKVVVAGAFTSFQGVPRNRIARLNSDGTLDGGFLSGL